ncbi:Uncharacterised protein [Mycobacteroides abscessus]|nr:Uncharacterised protein [Mycobacteroides abscessus]
MLDRCALGAGNRLHACDSRHAVDGLGELVDDQEVRGVPHIVIGLQDQHFRIHPGRIEVPVGGLEALIGGVSLGMYFLSS